MFVILGAADRRHAWNVVKSEHLRDEEPGVHNAIFTFVGKLIDYPTAGGVLTSGGP